MFIFETRRTHPLSDYILAQKYRKNAQFSLERICVAFFWFVLESFGFFFNLLRIIQIALTYQIKLASIQYLLCAYIQLEFVINLENKLWIKKMAHKSDINK